MSQKSPSTNVETYDAKLAHWATTVVIGASLTACAALMAACGGGGGFDCGAQTSSYESAIAQDGELVATVPAEGPYPMAIVLSQDGVNTMLQAVLDQELPPIPIEDDTTGVTMMARPSVPNIAIVSVDDCENCVMAHMDFGLDVDTGIFGSSSGSGTATVALPIQLVPKDNRSTALMAEMDKAIFMELDISVAGFSLSDFPGLQGIVEDEATNYIRQEFGATEVVNMDSWDIGQGDVLLAARGPLIFPEQGTILLGMHTNLSLPMTATLEEQASLPQGSHMGMQFHPELLLGMSKRLLFEGEIPRDLDEDGNAMARGNNHVSMDSMSSSGDALRTTFTVWRTGGGLCGFSTIGADMAMSLSGDEVTMSATNLAVEDSSGVGDFLNNDFVEGEFLDALARNLELTVNYRDFAVEGEEMAAVPSATSLNIDNRGLSIFLDLDLAEKSASPEE